MGCGKSDGRTRRGNSEPFFGVLHSRTRDLFKSQPPGEQKTVVLHLKNDFGKGRPVLDWREWAICAENGRGGRNGTRFDMEIVWDGISGGKRGCQGQSTDFQTAF